MLSVTCSLTRATLVLRHALGGMLDCVVVDFLFIVIPIVVGVCNCSMFCCALLCVRSSIAIILMGERESWLLCLICLPGVSWWLSGSSSRCHGVVCGLWLWYFLIILTYYFVRTRPSYMVISAHVLLNLLNELGKSYTMRESLKYIAKRTDLMNSHKNYFLNLPIWV